jgi:hypothetical protein
VRVAMPGRTALGMVVGLSRSSMMQASLAVVGWEDAINPPAKTLI